MARSVAEQSDHLPILWPVSAVMPHESLQVRLDTQSYLASRATPVSGVFLTHLHLDHVLGLSDVPKHTPLYVGPGEADDERFTHLLVRRTTERNLRGFEALRQWRVSPPSEGRLGVVDVFGDQTVLGLHAPGHTDGNMSFLIRSTNGPQLIVGDGCHTRFGWLNDVEPGSFNTDGDEAARSLAVLRRLAADHPGLRVHLGHQPLAEQSAEQRAPGADVGQDESVPFARYTR